jgi:hypothetical protein
MSAGVQSLASASVEMRFVSVSDSIGSKVLQMLVSPGAIELKQLGCIQQMKENVSQFFAIALFA